MATGILSITLEDKFGLIGRVKTKFLKEKWQKLQDAKLAMEKALIKREER